MSYNRDDNRGNNRGFGQNYERQMYKAICSECGKETQVPFKPKEDLPVYCKECYFKKKGGSTYKKREDNEDSY